MLLRTCTPQSDQLALPLCTPESSLSRARADFQQPQLSKQHSCKQHLALGRERQQLVARTPCCNARISVLDRITRTSSSVALSVRHCGPACYRRDLSVRKRSSISSSSSSRSSRSRGEIGIFVPHTNIDEVMAKTKPTHERPRIVFPGGGIFFWWQAGAVKALQEFYDLDAYDFAGASAGSLRYSMSTL